MNTAIQKEVAANPTKVNHVNRLSVNVALIPAIATIKGVVTVELS